MITALTCTNIHISSDKYSHGPETNGELRFRSGRGTTASSTVLPRSRIRSGFATDSTEDWEFTLADKSTAAIEKETRSTEMPSFDARLSSSRTTDGDV